MYCRKRTNRKYLTTLFARDQSGAVSVLFELGGIVLSAMPEDVQAMSVDLMSHGGLNRKVQFSAPDLRDMDAILEVMTAWWRSLLMWCRR